MHLIYDFQSMNLLESQMQMIADSKNIHALNHDQMIQKGSIQYHLKNLIKPVNEYCSHVTCQITYQIKSEHFFNELESYVFHDNQKKSKSI